MDTINLLPLIDQYVQNQAEREFEVTIKTPYQKYMALLQHMRLLYKNKKIENIESSLVLDIVHTSDEKKHRISVTDSMQMNNIKILVAKFDGRNNHYIFNQILQLKDKEMQKSIYFEEKYVEQFYKSEEFDYTAKLSVERQLPKDSVVLENTEKDNIVYRIKQRNRLSFDSGIYVDLTQVSMFTKISDLILKDKIEHNKKFEIEVEIQKKLSKDQKKTIGKEFCDKIEYIFKVLNCSPFILPKSLCNKVVQNLLQQFSTLEKQIKHINNIIRKPISMQLTHVSETIVKYGVTDKADGERFLLYVFENGVYLISMNHDVFYTGITVQDKNINGTVADGEKLFVYKYQKHIFLVFDVLFVGKTDIRMQSHHENRLNQFNNFFNKNYGVYFDFLKYENEQDSLNAYLKTQTAKLQSNIVETSIEKKRQTLIMNKFFAYPKNQENDIFKLSLMINNTYKTQSNYVLDGMMYHAIEQPYTTLKKDNKFPELKWKPVNKNSIDFLIKFKKDSSGNDIIVFDRTQSESENKFYKICYLYVDNNDEAVPFKIQQNIYLYIDKNLNEVVDIEGFPLYSNTIVEFIFDSQNTTFDQKNRWIPLKTRYDKTNTMRITNTKHGNNEYVANQVWNAIGQNFAIEDIQILAKDLQTYQTKIKSIRQRISQKDIVDMTLKNAYYNKELQNVAKPMKAFHNFVKSQLIYTFFNNQFNNKKPRSVLDLACGRGGDMVKMYYVAVSKYVGVDIDYNGLMSQVDGAMKRYEHHKNTMPNFPKMYFLQGDMGYPLTFKDQDRAFNGQLDNQFKELYNKFFPVDTIKR